MEKYVPDIYQKSIYTIDYDKLKARGIKCLLYDLDNTLVPFDVKEADQKIKNLFDELKEKGFKVIIFSNSPKTRLKPSKEYLDVDCSASSRKPFKASFLKILNEYKFSENEVAIIGDQILTDIIGGNKVGITTILINPISKKDSIVTKPNRFLEKRIMKKLKDHDLFFQGRYYE